MERALPRSSTLIQNSYQQSITIRQSVFSKTITNGGKNRRRGEGILFGRRWIGGSGGSVNGVDKQRSSLFTWYSRKLDTHPITTKCISAGLISSFGNIVAQRITHYQKQEENKRVEQGDGQDPFEVNYAQVSRFAFLNVIFVAPVLHHWYQFINRTVPGKSISRVLQRTFWDEFVFSPLYIPVFLASLWKLEGSSNENIWQMTKSEVPGIIVAEWVTWVPTMIVTFRYVPVKYQVLVINVIGVAWQTFLAYMASNAHAKEVVEDTVDSVAEQKHGVFHHPTPVIATTSTGQTDGLEIAADCSVEDESQREQHPVPPSVIVEEKVCPMVLNTIVRHETPKYIELDYMVMEDDYNQ